MENKMTKCEMWVKIVDFGIATDDELSLVTCINGYSEETLNDVVYARTGYRDLEQYVVTECL